VGFRFVMKQKMLTTKSTPKPTFLPNAPSLRAHERQRSGHGPQHQVLSRVCEAVGAERGGGGVVALVPVGCGFWFGLERVCVCVGGGVSGERRKPQP